MVNTDRRILKTRNVIKENFLKLLEVKEFEDITVTEIAERADIARKTFYLHYLDKYDLLDSIIDVHMTELQKTSGYNGNIDINESEFLWYEYIDKNFNFFSKMLGSKSTEYFRKKFLAFLIKDTDEEMKYSITDPKDREVVVQFFSYGALGLLEWWLNSEHPEDAETIARRTSNLYQSITPDE